MAFPSSPVNGQTAVVNKTDFQYSTATNTWTKVVSLPTFLSNISANGTVTIGNLTTTGTLATFSNVNITGTTKATTVSLVGTGINMILYSQTFAGSGWSNYNSSTTVTAGVTTAPDSTATGTALIEAATTGPHWIFGNNNIYLQPGVYTMSVYVKANGRTAVIVGLAYNGSGSSNYATVTFDLSGVTTAQTNVSSFAVVGSSITAAGGGWYRCVASINVPPNIGNILPVIAISNATSYTTGLYGTNSYTGDGASGLYIWGAQLEPYATVGTYIPTTTTALLGSPSISFGNVAQIGLLNDGSLYLQPYSTGALQAQRSDGTTTNGNARGAYAVDFQMSRGSSSQVASGLGAVLSGGRSNTSNGTDAFVGGGNSNSNTSSNQGVLGGGSSNSVSGPFAGVLSGYSNTAAGEHNFIGGGYGNSGTAGAAVTTQSATMNGTTAVTLAATNAAIKVGQIVLGTSINSFPRTYVAAISGTSLTLSQAAAGSSTSTLSFYTPHGVVVGGGNNQATGAYSFIGGGGDAGTATYKNLASGDWSVIAGGKGGTASGPGAFIGGGGYEGSTTATNLASGAGSVLVGGVNNTASGYLTSVLGGNFNKATGPYSTVLSGSGGITRGVYGYTVLNSTTAISFSSGISQAVVLLLAKQTTDATATVLTSDGGVAGTTNQLILPNNSAYYFVGTVIANVTGATDGAAWRFEGAIMRGANAASTVLIGTPTINRVASTANAAVWSLSLSSDTTNGGLAVTVTGYPNTTIRWVAKVETTEVTF